MFPAIKWSYIGNGQLNGAINGNSFCTITRTIFGSYYIMPLYGIGKCYSSNLGINQTVKQAEELFNAWRTQNAVFFREG
jgi:hypothetical protein